MTHLTASELVALRDGEDAVLDTGRTAHLDACPRCREALEAARGRARRIEGALRGGATPTPEAMERTRAAVRARLGEAAAPGGQVGDGAGAEGGTDPTEEADAARSGERDLAFPSASGGAWSLSRAAGLLLLLAGGAAALPGSPVRSWLAPSTERTEAPASRTPPWREPAPTPAAGPETAIRLRVDDGPVEVVVEDAAAGTRLEVERGEGPELEVRAPDGSRFASAERRVVIHPQGGPVRVRLPAGAVPATVRVGGDVYLRWTADGPEVMGPAVERAPERVVFRVEG